MARIKVPKIYLVLGNPGVVTGHPNDCAVLFSKNGTGNKGGYKCIGFISRDAYEVMSDACEAYNAERNK